MAYVIAVNLTCFMSDEESKPDGRRPIYKTETTGNYWQDVWEACKVRSFSIKLVICHAIAKDSEYP